MRSFVVSRPRRDVRLSIPVSLVVALCLLRLLLKQMVTPSMVAEQGRVYWRMAPRHLEGANVRFVPVKRENTPEQEPVMPFSPPIMVFLPVMRHCPRVMI